MQLWRQWRDGRLSAEDAEVLLALVWRDPVGSRDTVTRLKDGKDLGVKK